MDERATIFTLIDHHERIVKSGRIESGMNEIDVRGVASGSYFLRTAGNADRTRIMVL